MFGGAGGDDALLPEPDAVSTVSSEQTLIVTTAQAELGEAGHGTAFTAEPTTSTKSAQIVSAGENPPSGAMSLDRLSLTTTTSSTMSSEMDIVGPGGTVTEGKKR